MQITTRRASALIKDFLAKKGLKFSRVSARTVSFSDLARCSRIFVNVYGWTPNPLAELVETFAKQNGFSVTFYHAQ